MRPLPPMIEKTNVSIDPTINLPPSSKLSHKSTALKNFLEQFKALSETENQSKPFVELFLLLLYFFLAFLRWKKNWVKSGLQALATTHDFSSISLNRLFDLENATFYYDVTKSKIIKIFSSITSNYLILCFLRKNLR